jgi:hypothetical protein
MGRFLVIVVFLPVYGPAVPSEIFGFVQTVCRLLPIANERCANIQFDELKIHRVNWSGLGANEFFSSLSWCPGAMEGAHVDYL